MRTSHSKQNIAFLLIARTFGGMERRYLRLAIAIAESGNQVEIVLNEAAKELANSLEINLESAQLHILKDPPELRNQGLGQKVTHFWQRVIYLKKLRDVLSMVRAEHLHAISNPGALTLLLAVGLPRGLRLSYSLVDNSLLTERNTMLQRLFFSVSSARASFVDCLSPSLAEIAATRVPKSLHGKLAIAPCSFSDYGKVKVAQERDIDLLFLSRFVPGKGLDLLQTAASLLGTRNPTLHICGSGPSEPDIPNAVVYETSHSFEILGRTKIFLSLQTADNYPSQSLLEAMASGCAIIATDVGHTRLLLSETNAVLIPGHPGALAAAIIDLLEDSEKRVTMGKSARNMAITKHTVERYMEYFLREVAAQ